MSHDNHHPSFTTQRSDVEDSFCLLCWSEAINDGPQEHVDARKAILVSEFANLLEADMNVGRLAIRELEIVLNTSCSVLIHTEDPLVAETVQSILAGLVVVAKSALDSKGEVQVARECLSTIVETMAFRNSPYLLGAASAVLSRVQNRLNQECDYEVILLLLRITINETLSSCDQREEPDVAGILHLNQTLLDACDEDLFASLMELFQVTCSWLLYSEAILLNR